MSVRDRLLVGAAGALGHLFVRALGGTWRVSVVGREIVEGIHASGSRVIHAFWHGQLLGLEYAYRGSGICVLSSWHRDGEISARLMRSLGYEVVRGSTSRGSARGLLRMLSKLRQGHDLAVTPDGPRGPARVVKPGIFYLSEKSGAPIVPVAVWSSPRRTLGSWDGFVVPLPFARVVIVHGEPLYPDRGPDAGGDTGEGTGAEERGAALAGTLESLYERARAIGEDGAA